MPLGSGVQVHAPGQSGVGERVSAEAAAGTSVSGVMSVEQEFLISGFFFSLFFSLFLRRAVAGSLGAGFGATARATRHRPRGLLRRGIPKTGAPHPPRGRR
jgi:hypothetical protein